MRRHNISRLSLVSAAVMLAAGSVVSAGAQQQQQQQQKEQPQQQQPRPEQDKRQQPQQGSANQANRVDLDQLEDAPEKFVGKTVTVEGEVDRVLGPNLFSIDEKDWADVEREMPVVVPEGFAAIVRSDAPVRVTGTVQKVPIAQIERRGGVLTDPKIRAEIQEQPALVAKEVSTIAPAAVAVNLLVRPEGPVGTAGRPADAPITDVNQLGAAKDNNLVGRRVNLDRTTVSMPSDQGFWIRTPAGERIFVMPATKTPVKEGQTASIQGVVLQLPEDMRAKLNASGEQIYIYADRVTAR